MAAVQRVTDRLDKVRSDLLSEFVSTTDKNFLWISELNEALQVQSNKELSRSVMLPKTPSANKRRPKRKPLAAVNNDANTNTVTKSTRAKKKVVKEVVEEVEQPMTRQLRKRTVSMLNARPLTPDEDPEVVEKQIKRAKKSPKEATTATKKTKKTSKKGKKKSAKEIAQEEDKTDFSTPPKQQMVRRSMRHSVSTHNNGMVGAAIAALNAVTQTPVTAIKKSKITNATTPNTIVKKTPETVVKASRVITPETVVKRTTTTTHHQNNNNSPNTDGDDSIVMSTHTTPDTVVKKMIAKTPLTVIKKSNKLQDEVLKTPTTVVKRSASNDDNLVDGLSTPAARFAAAMAFANSPQSLPNSAVKAKANPIRSVTGVRNAQKQEAAILSNIRAVHAQDVIANSTVSPPPTKRTQRLSIRQSVEDVESANQVSRLIKQIQPDRKRKSDAISNDADDSNMNDADDSNINDADDEPTATPSKSYIAVKKDVLSVTRQNKKRMPSRSNIGRKPVDDQPSSSAPSTSSTLSTSTTAKGVNKVNSVLKGMKMFNPPPRTAPVPVKRAIQVPALQKAKKQREDADKAAKLAQEQKKLKSFAMAKKREEQEKIRKQKAEEEMLRKAKAQKERLAVERERKTAEEKERKEAMKKKQEVAEQRKRDIATQRAKLEEEARQRKEELKERETQLLQKKALTAKKLEETRNLYEQKKQKEALRLQELRQKRERDQVAKEQEVARMREERMRQQAQAATKQAQAQSSHDTCSSPMESYDLTHLQSDASSDDEDDPRAEVPKWAQGATLKNALYNQFLFSPPESKVTSIFPSPGPPVLEEIFPKKKTKFKARTSSAYWSPNPKTGGIMR